MGIAFAVFGHEAFVVAACREPTGEEGQSAPWPARAVLDPSDGDRGAMVMPCSPLALAMERSHGKLLGQEELGNLWDRRTSTLIFHIGRT